MRIKAKVPDYYDWVQTYNVHSRDPIVFNRRHYIDSNLDPDEIYHRDKWSHKNTYSRLLEYRKLNSDNNTPFKLNKEIIVCIAVCGKYYYFSQDKSTDPNGDLDGRLKIKFPNLRDKDPYLVELHKKYNSPILMFYIDNCLRVYKFNNQEFYLLNRIPLLTEYNFPKIVKAEAMFQEIEFFISNDMVDNPDINPPVTIGNKDLIVSKGFDLITSFRHPVK